MSKVFLDTNILIDATQDRGNKDLAETLDQHNTYISPLSIHILFYSHKIKVPSIQASETLSQFGIVDLTKSILDKSLEGPSSDLEDNIQMHSAAEVECDFFITRDKNLLKLRYFGKTQIIDHLEKN